MCYFLCTCITKVSEIDAADLCRDVMTAITANAKMNSSGDGCR